MIVEFIGCAGAGKTTLRRIMCENGSAGNRLVAMADLLLDRAVLCRITHPTAVNVVQEIGGLPFFVGAWRREHDYVGFASRMLARHAPSTFHKLNGMRGVVRKVGMYHLARARAPDRIVLSDEGTVLTAYDLFVTTDVDFGGPELEQFARLVPLPDAIVYVKAPIASLVERATSRPDPRRQHVGKQAAAVERNIRRTVELFDRLVTTAPLKGRVVVVDNDDSGPARRQRLAADIEASLRASISPN
jgi:hypothetical protein